MCFLLGYELGDAVEDLQQQTEELLEEAGEAAFSAELAAHHPKVQFTNELKSTWSDVRDRFIASQPGGFDCQFTDESTLAIVRELHVYLTQPRGIETTEVPVVRTLVDRLTARMASVARRTGSVTEYEE